MPLWPFHGSGCWYWFSTSSQEYRYPDCARCGNWLAGLPSRVPKLQSTTGHLRMRHGHAPIVHRDGSPMSKQKGRLIITLCWSDDDDYSGFAPPRVTRSLLIAVFHSAKGDDSITSIRIHTGSWSSSTCSRSYYPSPRTLSWFTR